MFIPGLVSVTFRSLTVEEIIDLCKSNNLTCIEWGSDVHIRSGDFKAAERAGESCLKNGIIPCSYGSYYRMGQGIYEFSKYLDTARALGAKVIRIWAGTKSPKVLLPSEYDALLREGTELARLAEKAGIIIATECHLDTLTEDARTAAGFIKKIDSPFFATYWQPNQFKTFGQNEFSAELLSPFTVGIHIFNWDQNGRHPLFEAKEKWTAYLSHFSGDNIPVMLEFMHDDRPESLAPTASQLSEILKQFDGKKE